MPNNQDNQLVKLDNFVANARGAKSPIQNLIHHIAREVNRNKLSYDQLRYVFKSVRERCDVKVPAKRRKLYELPSEVEMTSFFAAIENPIHKLIFEFLNGSGLRVAELCNLEVSRVDFSKNLVFINEGKGGKDRVTVIGNRLKEKLRLYLEGRNNRYLFESNRNTKFTTRRIEQLCKRYKEKAGLEKSLTPHTFRHLWNTRLAEAGVSREGREILSGHSKGSATQDIYTHLGVGGIKDEVIKILDKEQR